MLFSAALFENFMKAIFFNSYNWTENKIKDKFNYKNIKIQFEFIHLSFEEWNAEETAAWAQPSDCMTSYLREQKKLHSIIRTKILFDHTKWCSTAGEIDVVVALNLRSLVNRTMDFD